MNAQQWEHLAELIIICSAVVTVIYPLGVKIIEGRQTRLEKIELAKIKEGAFGEEEVKKLRKALEHLAEDALRNEKLIKEMERKAEHRITEIERQWQEFREEIRRANKEQREMAEQWTEIFKGWAESNKQTRQYINDQKT